LEAELAALRERVDAIDTQLLALLNARAAVVRDIYAVKQRQGVPRFNQARTDAILQRLTADNQGPLSAQEVRALFTPLLEFFVKDYRSAEGEPAADGHARPPIRGKSP
jgi:3-deoxy-7-phosphoheptulonate synthase/chorismate mutase